MINHIETETRLKLYIKAAVRNIGQWTKVWSSKITWRKTTFGCKLLLIVKIMTFYWISPG